MKWLIELLAAIAAASNDHSQISVGGDVDHLPASTPRTLTYRSRDGSAFFRFRFTLFGNDIRIHVLEFPNMHAGSCHVLKDGHGPYICWSQAIRSMAEAKAVTAIWAEATLVYQRTGRTF